MTIKKYSRNQRFTDDYEDRQAKPQKKDRSEKRIKKNDLFRLITLSCVLQAIHSCTISLPEQCLIC